MKSSIFCIALIFSFSAVSAQVSTPQKQSTKQVTPATQKKPVTPVKPKTNADVAPKVTPVSTTKDITGFWLTANKASIVQFYREGNVYMGKVAWQRQNKDKSGKPLTDVNNPDRAKRSNPIVGTQMISNLKYNPSTKTYEGGKVYMPQTGKTYDCKVKLKNNNDQMEITATAGLSMISKTFIWSRTTGIPSRK